MRVALFTYGVQPRGGVVHALALAEALVARGIDAVLVALDDTGRGLFRAARCPVELVRVERAAGDDAVASVHRRIDALVSAFGPALRDFDIHHAFDGITGNALATLVERGTLASFVRTVHHLDAFDDPELAALQDRSVVRASRCFTGSAAWRREIAARYGIEATLVPTGVDLERFFPVDAGRRHALREGLDIGDVPLFVAIGGVERRKNALRVLEAFVRVRASLADARLILAGGASMFDHGAYRDAFDARANELGGAGLTVTGALPDAEIVALLRAADAVVFASLAEGFGLVALEALACGTPLVASDRAPFTEYLEPGDAVFVDPLDAGAIAAGMSRCLDVPTAATLRARGPAVAARHTWAAAAAAHAALYRSLASREETERAGDAFLRTLAG